MKSRTESKSCSTKDLKVWLKVLACMMPCSQKTSLGMRPNYPHKCDLEVAVWFHDFARLFHHVQFMPESLPQWPVIVLTGYCFSHIRCCLQCKVHVKRNDTCLRKPLPLFCHFAFTNKTPEDANADP